jgi:hypothetical protein
MSRTIFLCLAVALPMLLKAPTVVWAESRKEELLRLIREADAATVVENERIDLAGRLRQNVSQDRQAIAEDAATAGQIFEETGAVKPKRLSPLKTSRSVLHEIRREIPDRPAGSANQPGLEGHDEATLERILGERQATRKQRYQHLVDLGNRIAKERSPLRNEQRLVDRARGLLLRRLGLPAEVAGDSAASEATGGRRDGHEVAGAAATGETTELELLRREIRALRGQVGEISRHLGLAGAESHPTEAAETHPVATHTGPPRPPTLRELHQQALAKQGSGTTLHRVGGRAATARAESAERRRTSTPRPRRSGRTGRSRR